MHVGGHGPCLILSTCDATSGKHTPRSTGFQCRSFPAAVTLLLYYVPFIYTDLFVFNFVLCLECRKGGLEETETQSNKTPEKGSDVANSCLQNSVCVRERERKVENRKGKAL